jgi:hypothetical protein
MKLSTGMFGTKENPNRNNEFHIYTGQVRGGDAKLAHRAGWYNFSGDRLGHGDLSVDDFLNIQNALEYNAALLVLPETASFPEFTKVNIQSPGKKYVLNSMVYAITPSYILLVNNRVTRFVTKTIGDISIYPKSRAAVIDELEYNARF